MTREEADRLVTKMWSDGLTSREARTFSIHDATVDLVLDAYVQGQREAINSVRRFTEGALIGGVLRPDPNSASGQSLQTGPGTLSGGVVPEGFVQRFSDRWKGTKLNNNQTDQFDRVVPRFKTGS